MHSPLTLYLAISLSVCTVLVAIICLRVSRLPFSWRRRPKSNNAPLKNAVTVLSGLSFKDALDFQRAKEHVQRSIVDSINLGSSGDTLVTGIEVLNLAESRELLLAKFPEAAQTLLTEKKAILLKTKNGGELLAATKDGRIFSHARKVEPSAIHHLATIGPAVVGAAHIIAGYDNAQKLKKIDRKLNFVISSRFNDMVAELESIYECTKECSSQINEVDRTHLHHLRLRLKHLRCAWVAEVEGALSNIENPDDRKTFDKWFSARKKTARKIQNALFEQEQPLYLIRFSVALEEIIASIMGDHDKFDDITLPDVKLQVERLRNQIRERQQWVAKLDSNLKEELQQAKNGFEAFEISLGKTEKSAVDDTFLEVAETAAKTG